MKRPRVVALSVGALVAAAASVALISGSATGERNGAMNNVIARQLAVENGTLKATKFDKPISSGVLNTIEAAQAESGGAGAFAAPTFSKGTVPTPPSGSSQGCPGPSGGGGGQDNGGSITNVRVNQDCSLRRQAEEVVAVNPRNSHNVIAGQNDSIIGFNHCGYDWSLDGGRTWGSVGTAPPPFWGEILLDGHTSDACSDPTATFDSQGNAYISGILFDISSPANGIFVAKSNNPIQGRFYHTPLPLSFQEYRTSPLGQVASDIDPNIVHDKELMIADTRPSSPKRDRVYVTWTRFEANGTPVGGRSPIVFSQSLDGGATWSPAVIISGASGTACTFASGTPDNPNACDQDQGSDPVVGPDGTIYVVFSNGNRPGAGIEQEMMVKCPATNACDKESDWTAPVRIGELIGTHPIGDPGNAGGCPTGRQCLPPNGYRVPETTSQTISVDRAGNLYATWADFRNGKAPCTPLSPWSTAKPPCNNDVFYAFSSNGGTTWSPTINVTAAFGETAQWQPWSDVMGDGSALQVAFYDRHYGNCEFSGCNDITLATIRNPRSLTPSISYQRITTSSMPNLTPANNPVQAGFLGDYMWVEVSRHNFNQRATHIVWADTRQLFGSAPEEDIRYTKVGASEADNNNTP